MNILLLIQHKSSHVEYDTHDFSALEIDFVNYLSDNKSKINGIYAALPTVDELYAIAEDRIGFYPFGTVKGYTALSLHREGPVLREMSLVGVISLVRSVSTDLEIDDVSNATWKFLNTIFAANYVDLNEANDEQLMDVLTYLRHISLAYKSDDLR